MITSTTLTSSAASSRFPACPKPSPVPPVDLSNKKVMAQVYSRMRGAVLQILLPVLCLGCKEALAKASSKQPLPEDRHGLCKTCKLNLVMRHIPLGNADKTVEQATSAVKAKVIAEIEVLLGRSPVVRPPTPPASPAPPKASLPEPEEACKKELELPLSTDLPIYETFTVCGVDWCRYCGTTAGSSWRLGPWGARTLCFRHGRDWSVHKRLDLSAFSGSPDRKSPVLQDYCKICWSDEGIVRKCHGCANGFHAQCYLQRTGRNVSCLLVNPWYCNSTCCKHFETGSIRVTHSTKDKLPLMTYEEGEAESEEAKDSFDSEPVAKPSSFVILRLKAPERPLTPAIAAPSSPPKEKRRFSCPVEAIKPAKKARKARDPHRNNSVPDFLISIDHNALHKKTEEVVKKAVLVPEFKLVSRPARPAGTPACKEKMSELVFQARHVRFEETEKHTRLLKPDVLKALFGKAA